MGISKMAIIPCFDAPHLEAACKVRADTTMGLKGDEIGYILKDMGVADPDPAMTKWKRLFNALVFTQNKHQVGLPPIRRTHSIGYD